MFGLNNFGLMSAGAAWKQQQQAIANSQNEQRIRNLLANDAQRRALVQGQVEGTGMGLRALGAMQGASTVPPAPAPGQSSTPASVSMPGASQVQPPPRPPIAPQAPPVASPPFAHSQGTPQGDIGRALAVVQNNMPLQLLTQVVQNAKKMYPNISDEQLYGMVQGLHPELAAQAKEAISMAGLSVNSYFKGIDAAMREQSIQAQVNLDKSREQALRAQIPLDNARAAQANAMANLYGGTGNNSNFSSNFATWQALNPGKQPTRYMMSIMERTDPGSFRQTLSSGVSFGATRSSVEVALKQATKQESVLNANYSSFRKQMAYAVELAKKVPNLSSSPWWNGKVLDVQTKLLGNPEAKSYVDVLLAARSEFAKIINGGGVVVSVDARKKADEILSPNITVGQLQALLPTMEQEGKNIISGYSAQITELNKHLTGATEQAVKGSPPTPDTSSGPPEVNSQAAYDALAPGAQYTNNGQTYTKKGP